MKLADFVTIEVKENIAICWLDHQYEKMNVVSPAVIEIFEEIGTKVLSQDDIHAVIFISRKKDFMAGADIKSFQIVEWSRSIAINGVVRWILLNGLSIKLNCFLKVFGFELLVSKFFWCRHLLEMFKIDKMCNNQ